MPDQSRSDVFQPLMSKSGVEEESSLLLSVPSNNCFPVLDLKASVDATDVLGYPMDLTRSVQYGMQGSEHGFHRPLKPDDAHPTSSAQLQSSARSHLQTQNRSQDAQHLGHSVQVSSVYSTITQPSIVLA